MHHLNSSTFPSLVSQHVFSCKERKSRPRHWRCWLYRLTHCTPRLYDAIDIQVVELIQTGYNVVILDNLCNSSTEAVRRIEAIVNKSVPFEEVDLCDFEAVKAVFGKYDVDSVIHFAGLKVRMGGGWLIV